MFNVGKQNIYIKYGSELSSKNVNSILYKVMPDGVYEGFNCSLNGNILNVSKGICVCYDNTNKVAVKIETDEDISFEIPSFFDYVYLVIRYQYADVENNYAEFLFTSTILQDDVVIVKLYKYGSDIVLDYNEVKKYDIQKNEFKFVYNNITKKLNVSGGIIYIDGYYVNIQDKVLDIDINTDGYYLVIIKDNEIKSFFTGNELGRCPPLSILLGYYKVENGKVYIQRYSNIVKYRRNVYLSEIIVDTNLNMGSNDLSCNTINATLGNITNANITNLNVNNVNANSITVLGGGDITVNNARVSRIEAQEVSFNYLRYYNKYFNDGKYFSRLVQNIPQPYTSYNDGFYYSAYDCIYNYVFYLGNDFKVYCLRAEDDMVFAIIDSLPNTQYIAFYTYKNNFYCSSGNLIYRKDVSYVDIGFGFDLFLQCNSNIISFVVDDNYVYYTSNKNVIRKNIQTGQEDVFDLSSYLSTNNHRSMIKKYGNKLFVFYTSYNTSNVYSYRYFVFDLNMNLLYSSSSLSGDANIKLSWFTSCFDGNRVFVSAKNLTNNTVIGIYSIDYNNYSYKYINNDSGGLHYDGKFYVYSIAYTKRNVRFINRIDNTLYKAVNNYFSNNVLFSVFDGRYINVFQSDNTIYRWLVKDGL